MKTLFTFLLLFTISIFNNAEAQTNNFTNKIEAYENQFPIEKLYLTFDKSYYNVGDTLWFKSVLLNADFKGSQRTDKIYVELFSDSLKFIENRVIALNNGLGYGDFALTNKLKEGTYVIRAYSNWQQNFGSDYFFQKSFYIGNAGDNTWLLNSFQEINNTANSKTLDLKLRITNLKNEAIGLKDIELILMDGKKRIAKADLQTKLDGKLETKIPLGNEKITPDFNVIITDKKDKSQKSVLPIKLQHQDQLDLQFMPEGGYMVNGIFGKVAFKSIGNDGLGKDVVGKIVNSRNETLAALQTIHNGMGSFYLLPNNGENYTAVYSLNGKEQRQKLPMAKEEGTTIRIDQLSNKDSIYVYLKASEEKRSSGYLLLAQANGAEIMRAELNLKNGFSTLKLSKKDFPDGVIHFTLFSPDAVSLNERQVFINRKQKITLNIKPDKNNYATKDSVSLEITASNEDGKPLSGSFAISVTDDGQVKQEKNENMVSYFLLQSELKGNIENVGWYFRDEEPSTLLAMDHLLLTQGWVGYNWVEILKNKEMPKFRAEKGNGIEGNLTNLLKNPVPNINLTLMSLGKTIFVTDTTSNIAGEFKFTDLPYLDSAAYTIKIKNAKGKTAYANIFVNEFTAAKDINYAKKITPWYVNTDSTTLRYFKNTEKTKKSVTAAQLALEGTSLKEVEIKGQAKLISFRAKTAWDSKFIKEITEEELKKVPRKTLLDLLNEKIPAFTTGNFYADGAFGTESYEIAGEKFPPASRPRRHIFINYMIGGYLVSHVMIDGINTHFVSNGTDDQIGNVSFQANVYGVSRTALYPEVFFANKQIFNQLSAEDIVNISIYRGASNYYLDIKTRSGKGPWIVTTPGVYVYRPLPVYLAKEFYSPKYTTANKSLPDYRSTIFWDANVVTDENGKAKVSFFTADKPSSYTIKFEGTDLNGRFGFQKSNIIVMTNSSK